MWNRYYYVTFISNGNFCNTTLHFFGAGWFNRFSLKHAYHVIGTHGFQQASIVFWSEISGDDHRFLSSNFNHERDRRVSELTGRSEK